VGLSDAEIADVVYAAAARAFFTRVLDGLGAHSTHRRRKPSTNNCSRR
jgi:hypothetical protein